jgi:hypothetical protein
MTIGNHIYIIQNRLKINEFMCMITETHILIKQRFNRTTLFNIEFSGLNRKKQSKEEKLNNNSA